MRNAVFYQADEESIQEMLGLLNAPRLLAQPHLVLALEHCASMMPCREIDLIFARMSARTPLTFPLALPAGLIDISETPDDWLDNNSAAAEEHQDLKCGRANSLTSWVEIHTLGGWMITLKAVAKPRVNVHDERQLFAHPGTALPLALRRYTP